jgi:hypothetical protein
MAAAGTSSAIGIGGLIFLGVLVVLAAIIASGGKIGSSPIPAIKTLPRQILAAAAGLAILGGAWYWDHERTANRFLRVTGARLTRESPVALRGRCPLNVEYSGLISTNGGHKGTVTYRLKTNSGAYTSFRVLHFNGESGKPIAAHYTASHTERSEAFIEVVAPNFKNSKRVAYSVICD